MRCFVMFATMTIWSFAAAASGVVIPFQYGGVVEIAGASNPFGLAVNDTVTVTGTFDTADIANDAFIGDFAPLGISEPNGTLMFDLGAIMLTESDDFGFAFGGFPLLLVTGTTPTGVLFDDLVSPITFYRAPTDIDGTRYRGGIDVPLNLGGE